MTFTSVCSFRFSVFSPLSCPSISRFFSSCPATQSCNCNTFRFMCSNSSANASNASLYRCIDSYSYCCVFSLLSLTLGCGGCCFLDRYRSNSSSFLMLCFSFWSLLCPTGSFYSNCSFLAEEQVLILGMFFLQLLLLSAWKDCCWSSFLRNGMGDFFFLRAEFLYGGFLP